SGPFLQLVVGELQLGERAHAIEIVRGFLDGTLRRLAAAAQRAHARKAHHHLRVDVLGAGGDADAASRADADPAERLRRARLAAQDGMHAADHRFAVARRDLRVLRHRADFVALAAARARAEDALVLALLELLQPLADDRS